MQKRERLYEVWAGMKGRCNNPNHSEYHRYGAKGIRVCDEWSSYSNFRAWAYENGYDENAPRNKCTIDRIDSTKNYEPSNCRWVDFLIQSNNTNRNKLIEYNGVIHTMAEWSRIVGISYYALRSRLRRGKSIEDALYNGHFSTNGKKI